jgi:hypothetical protein
MKFSELVRYSLMIEATDDPTFLSFYSPDLGGGFTGVGHSIENCSYTHYGLFCNVIASETWLKDHSFGQTSVIANEVKQSPHFQRTASLRSQ